ncbi:MAG: hypothetical protein K9M80_03420, partial [Candidatus Marinimicrobia bacterium]|nr:hypothetical protein [Candidatus Neomarinimicrobiota bacterium]
LKGILQDIETNSQNNKIISALSKIQKDIAQEKLVSPAIWMMSDFQSQSNEFSQSLKNQLKNLNNGQLLFFPIKYEQENYSLVNASFPEQLLEINNELKISALLNNEGNSGKIPLSLFIEGERAGRTTLNFSERNELRTDFSFIPTKPGVLNGELALSADPFMADNTHYFSVHIPAKLQVLLVRNSDRDSPYLTKALQVYGKDKLQLKSTDQDAFATENLFRYDIIIFSDLEGINISQINTFLDQGGGALILPNRDGARQNYNQFSNKIGLPEWNRTQNFSENNYVKLGNIKEEHPIFQNIWQGEKKLAVQFYQIPWFNITNQKVLASYENDAPFLIIPQEQTNVVLMATNPAENWTDIQLTGLFVPLLHRIISYLGGQTDFNFSYTVGDTIQLNQFNLDNTQNLLISTPSGREYKPEVKQGEIIFKRTTEPGIYDIYNKNREATSFAVNISAKEKQCQYLDSEALQKFSTNQNNLLVYSENSSTSQKTAGEISHWLLIAVLALAIFEIWLVRGE